MAIAHADVEKRAWLATASFLGEKLLVEPKFLDRLVKVGNHALTGVVLGEPFCAGMLRGGVFCVVTEVGGISCGPTRVELARC